MFCLCLVIVVEGSSQTKIGTRAVIKEWLMEQQSGHALSL